jgi:putative ABC transport system substrate-binding protein
MNRRIFLSTLTGGLLSTPFIAGAQPRSERVWRVGYLSPAEARNPIDDAFDQSMRGLGYVEGQNIVFDRRYSRGQSEALAPLAAELVALRPDLLVAWSAGGALAAKRAASQLPVVFLAAGNPVEMGLVLSMAKPGGNLTGISFTPSLGFSPKGLQLLKETMPGLRRVALLAASEQTYPARQSLFAAARELRLELQEVVLATSSELDAAVRHAKDQGAQALQILPSGLTYAFRKQLADLALSHHLPSIHFFREAAVAGGLLSYAANLSDIAKRGATYVDMILKGAKVGDLPVEEPTKFELIINLKTAKGLGMTIPQSLLLRADEVIQ